MKKTRGFSYIEVLIAMALFAIALLAIIPMLAHAGRNMAYAQESHASHLQAQRLMLVVRDALTNGANPVSRASNYADGDFEFSFWVFGPNAQEFHSSSDVAAATVTSTMTIQASTVIVVIWGEDGQVAGRAIGMLY